jgi:hypothetical protein
MENTPYYISFFFNYCIYRYGKVIMNLDILLLTE